MNSQAPSRGARGGIDITPSIPADRQVIHAYGDGGIRVNDQVFKGSVLVFPDWVVAWPVRSMADLTVDSLAAVRAAEPPVEILLVGCGASLVLIAESIRLPMRQAGVAIDGMDTGGACRTYNVLLAEERRVAAALIAIS